MPEVFRLLGFSFFFYANDHTPIHIHVEGKGGIAKFIWDGEKFALMGSQNIKVSDMKSITEVIEENKDLIIKYWVRFFNSDKE
jgi:hypothetical protein